MALVFRQTITTNADEVLALSNAINHYLFKPLQSEFQISAAEYLATEPLKKLARRLENKVVAENRNAKRRNFSFVFTPAEVVAICICILTKDYKFNPFLWAIIGKVQQVSLNLENRILLQIPQV